MHTIQEKIIQYWTNRAGSYSIENNEELAGTSTVAWLNELTRHFPKKNDLKILDIGTGPGFMAILLSRAGYQVTGIDCTEEMLKQAHENARKYHLSIRFLKQPAEHLEFEDNSVDVIINRNLTWNLENPTAAYQEWYRVLKPLGKLIVFDANWYHYLFSEELRNAYEEDRQNVKRAHLYDHNIGENFDQMERIAEQLPMTLINRPSWDKVELEKIGFQDIQIDTEVYQRVWTQEEKINYASTPLFEIVATK